MLGKAKRIKNMKTANEEKIPVIFCIDVEPDDSQINRTVKAPWVGYEEMFEYAQRLRESLKVSCGQSANFSWLFRLDPQVEETYGDGKWPLTHYDAILEALIEEGDEFGIHPHAFRWMNENNCWITDHADQQWVNYCIQTSYDHFKQHFGYAPRIHRFGARWLSNETVNYVEDLQIPYEITLEPGYDSHAAVNMKQRINGTAPDLRNVPKYPYKCGRHDFTVEDPRARQQTLMIPITTGKVNYKYGRFEHAWRSIVTPKLVKPFCMSAHVATRQPRLFRELIDQVVSAMDKPYLALLMRSNSVSIDVNRQMMDENFNMFMAHPLRERFVFATIENAMDMLGYAQVASPEGAVR